MQNIILQYAICGCPGWSESSLGAQSLCWFCHVAAHIMNFGSNQALTPTLVGKPTLKLFGFFKDLLLVPIVQIAKIRIFMKVLMTDLHSTLVTSLRLIVQ